MSTIERDTKAAKAKLAKFEHRLEVQVVELQRKLNTAETAEAEADHDVGRSGLDRAGAEPMDGIELGMASVRVSESALDTSR